MHDYYIMGTIISRRGRKEEEYFSNRDIGFIAEIVLLQTAESY